MVLLFVVIALTFLLLMLGLQIYYILREVRRTIERTNRMIEDVETITHSLSGGISQLSNLTTGLKFGAVIASIFKKFKHRVEEEADGEE